MDIDRLGRSRCSTFHDTAFDASSSSEVGPSGIVSAWIFVRDLHVIGSSLN